MPTEKKPEFPLEQRVEMLEQDIERERTWRRAVVRRLEEKHRDAPPSPFRPGAFMAGSREPKIDADEMDYPDQLELESLKLISVADLETGDGEETFEAHASVHQELPGEKNVEIFLSVDDVADKLQSDALRHGFHLQMNPKTARSLAYALLWHANRIDGGK